REWAAMRGSCGGSCRTAEGRVGGSSSPIGRIASATPAGTTAVNTPRRRSALRCHPPISLQDGGAARGQGLTGHGRRSCYTSIADRGGPPMPSARTRRDDGRRRGRLSYANVVSTLALVLAIGGGSAVAAGTLSGKSKPPHPKPKPKLTLNS